MDPEAAIDEIKERVRVAERLMDAAVRRRDERYMVSAYEQLQDADEYVTALMGWVRSGGFKPSRFNTWIGRYQRAYQRHASLAERIRQGAWY